MKILLFVLLTLCISIQSLGQKEFTPGYVIKISGDTLHGYLQEEIRSEIYSQVEFKTAESDSLIQTFAPSELKLFKYESGNLYRTISFINTLGDTAVPQTSFALQLVEGFYNLYSYILQEQTYFVVIGYKESYFIYNSVYANLGDRLRQGNYISMLESLANTCQKINFRIEQIFYDEKEIAKFIFDLDKCISPKSVSLNYYRNPKTQIQFVVFAGGLPLGSSSQITAEGNLRIIYPQFSKHASINIGIHFSNTVQGNNQPYFGTVYNKQYEIFSVPVTFQGSFSIGIVHPYVYLGLSASDIKEKSNNAEYASYLGLQNKFTVDALCGIGIEVHITKQLFAKVDWRYELVVQYPAVGIAFKF